MTVSESLYIKMIELYHQNPNIFNFIYFSSFFFLKIVGGFYIILRIYKVLCYSKLTLEWLPMINPYYWPFSVFLITTNKYFALWSKIFPVLRFKDSSIDISSVVGLETLNSLIYLCVKFGGFLDTFLQVLDVVVRNLKEVEIAT
jgi:hypothetical protein